VEVRQKAVGVLNFKLVSIKAGQSTLEKPGRLLFRVGVRLSNERRRDDRRYRDQQRLLKRRRYRRPRGETRLLIVQVWRGLAKF